MNTEAHVVFWHTPEIVDNVVSFLDVQSIIELSQVVNKAADLAGGRVTFSRLVTNAGIMPLSREQAGRAQVQNDTLLLMERIHPFVVLMNRMKNPYNAISIIMAHICKLFIATDLDFKSVRLISTTDDREAYVTLLGFELIDWIDRNLVVDGPIFNLKTANVHILGSTALVRLTARAIRDGLGPQDFSAYTVSSETDVEAETILQLATYFRPVGIRSVALFRGTTPEAWGKIYEAICRMEPLLNDEPGRRGFQVILN